MKNSDKKPRYFGLEITTRPFALKYAQHLCAIFVV